MSDEVAEASAATDVSAGTLLRRAREGSGLHVAALAVALKVPVWKLEALEEGRAERRLAAIVGGLVASARAARRSPVAGRCGGSLFRADPSFGRKPHARCRVGACPGAGPYARSGQSG